MLWRDIKSDVVEVTPPVIEPVSRAEAKLHLQVDLSADDTLIDSLIVAAREHVEQLYGVTFAATTFDLWLDRFPSGPVVPISRWPLVSVSSIKSYDDDDTESVLAASNYLVASQQRPGRVLLADGGAWPTDLRPADGAVIRFVAGFTDDPVSIGSIAESGGVATVTTSAAHGYSTNDRVVIAGASPDGHNGVFPITVTGSTTFTHAVESGLGAASGTMTATRTTVPHRYVQAVKLWMLHLYRPATVNEEAVQRTFDSLFSDCVPTLG